MGFALRSSFLLSFFFSSSSFFLSLLSSLCSCAYPGSVPFFEPFAFPRGRRQKGMRYKEREYKEGETLARSFLRLRKFSSNFGGRMKGGTRGRLEVREVLGGGEGTSRCYNVASCGTSPRTIQGEEKGGRERKKGQRAV